MSHQCEESVINQFSIMEYYKRLKYNILSVITLLKGNN